jgi:hypothetical protein
MRRSPRILPECYGDTLLIEILGYSKPNHQQPGGINRVLDTLEKKYPGQTAVGIIDKDKKITPAYFQNFQKQKETNHLILRKHRQRNHYLILVIPALERFLLTAAAECGIPDTEIPFTEKRLKDISKTQHADSNQQLKQFMNRIIQKKAPGTETLKTWLNEILGKDH